MRYCARRGFVARRLGIRMLYRIDEVIDDWTTVTAPETGRKVKRGKVRFHPGTTSVGCTTVPKSRDWKKIEKILLGTSTETIPGTNTTYYRIVTVK